MKRTDQERIERELRRREKHAKVIARKADRPDEEVEKPTPSAYVKNLHSLLHHDETMVYNARDDDDILDLFLQMKEDLPEDQWENVLKSAVRKTKVAEKDTALDELRETLSEC